MRLLLALLSLAMILPARAGRCKGDDPCAQCQDCSACRYCDPKNPKGGSCGTCRDQSGPARQKAQGKRPPATPPANPHKPPSVFSRE